MHRQAQSPTPLFRTISLVVIAAFTISDAAITAFAQNSVPPTAVQAAKMPQFAPRLAHPASQLVPPKAAAPQRGKMPRRPLDSSDIYDNGPINGNTDAWAIDFGFIVSDTFNIVSDGTNITGMSFGEWLFPGDTLTSVELSITSGENGGTGYFDQTVNITQGSCTPNLFGYNVCPETSSFNGPTLNAGTYWVNLQNASLPNGDPTWWDENSGVGCQGQDCPSEASENAIGSIPSESFTILGSSSTSTTIYNNFACPAPQTGWQDLFDFSADAAPSGLAIDRAGKFFGNFGAGGNSNAGVLFQFAQRAGHWLFSSLYSFLGGSQGSSPDGVIVGPGGSLYGVAQGGIQNCGYNGSFYCGLIYEARPGPAACPTALCGWNETTIYQFTGNTDASYASVNTFDSAGNLYGVGNGGGAYSWGVVFELTPSQGGWTETLLHSFTGGADGGVPTSLLVGQDGNLYGTASRGGGSGVGLVFELLPSGGGWTENVIYNFTGYTDGGFPYGLIQDSSGNLYGVTLCGLYNYCGDIDNLWYGGLIFKLTPSSNGWTFSVIYNNNFDCAASETFRALALDGSGNLYAAEGAADETCEDLTCYVYNCGQVVAVPSHRILLSGNADVFTNLTADPNGALYGTTDTCGLNSPHRAGGMFWQYSP